MIDTDRIRDWSSFHDVFQEAMGFPEFYGRNMDAWIDCMSDLDTPGSGMTSIHAPRGGVLALKLSNAAGLADRCPDIYDAIVECTAFVNFRRLNNDEPPVLALAYVKRA